MKIQVTPYLRGFYPRDFLYKLWRAIEHSKCKDTGIDDWDNIFWEERYPEHDRPVARKGDLVDWIKYIENDDTLLLIGTEIATQHLIGITWFNRLKPTSCHSAIWVHPEYRGLYSRELVDLSLEHMFRIRGMELIYASTPHYKARNLVKKFGYKDECKIDGIFWLTCRKGDYYVKRREQQDKALTPRESDSATASQS